MIVPSFLKFPVYAFDLSDLSYKYLRLTETKKGILVDDFGEGDIPPGIIEHGEIKKQDVLQAFLKDLLSKKNIRFVALSLPEEKGFVRNIKLVGLKDEKEIGGALRLQIEEHVPLPPDEVVFDFSVASKEKDYYDVVLSAFPKQFIDFYADTFFEVGAIPVVMESEMSASLKAIIKKDFLGTAMLIDWGKTRTSFAIVENGALRFASSISIGGQDINETLKKNLGIDFAKAEELKKKYGLTNSGSEGGAVFQALVPMVTAIGEEAEKYVSFWQTHSEKKKSVSQIFLSGGDANLKGLKEYLELELGVPVQMANPWVNVHFPKYYLPELGRSDSIRYSAAVGLALSALSKGKTL